MYSYEEEARQLWFFDLIVSSGRKAYFSAGWFNGLIEADLETGVSEILSRFPEEEIFVSSMHHNLICINQKLYFTPSSTKWLYIYDISLKEMKKINLPRNEVYWEERDSKFIKMIPYENMLYLIPTNYNQMLCFNLETEEFLIYDEWFEEVKRLVDYKEEEIKFKRFLVNHMECEDVILAQIDGTNYFLVFEICTGNVSVVEFKGEKIVSIEMADSNPMFVCQDGACWNYNTKEKKFEYIDNWEINVQEVDQKFVKEGDVCYFASLTKNEVIIYNIKTKEKLCIEFLTDKKRYENAVLRSWKMASMLIKRIGDKIYFLNQYNEVIEFDIYSKVYTVRRFMLSSHENNEVGFVLPRDGNSIRYYNFPYNCSNLNVLMHVVSSMGDKLYKTNSKSCGEKIFEIISK